jgi:hypothetical protein
MHALEALDEPRIVRHRLSVDDCYRMAEVGVLAHDARVELIEGEIIEMAPMGSRHCAAVAKLTWLLVWTHVSAVMSPGPYRFAGFGRFGH